MSEKPKPKLYGPALAAPSAAPALRVGLVVYWPKAPNTALWTVTRCWDLDRDVELTDDYGSRKRWAKTELSDTLTRGFAVIWHGIIPQRARRRLYFVDRSWGDFRHMRRVEIEIPDDVRVVYGCLTTFGVALVGVVDANGRIVRKQAVLAETERILSMERDNERQ